MFGWLRNLFSSTAKGERVIRGVGYDAARSTPGNKHIWRWADGADADASNSPSVRQALRNRARVEVANNPALKGTIKTKVNDLAGTGPRLHMATSTPGAPADSDVNLQVRAKFNAWAKAVKLTRKLRTAIRSRFVDGEAFLIFMMNDNLVDPLTREPFPVKLDIRNYEADQIATPNLSMIDPNAVDGIVFDIYGNPSVYHLLKRHPGDSRGAFVGLNNKEDIAAGNVIHWFEPERPGQSRGVAELSASLSTWPEIRRFVTATIGAAETAAAAALVFYNEASSLDDESDASLWSGQELAPRTAITAPPGYKPEQIKAEHPTTTFGDFLKRMFGFVLRPLLMPFNVAMGDSSGHNFSSGKLDILPYQRSNDIDQTDVETEILERVFAMWLRFAVLVEGYLPEPARARDYAPEHEWFWDEPEDIDSQKEASATEIRCRSGQSSPWREHAKNGRDPEREDQLAAASYGVDVKMYRAALFAKTFGGNSPGTDTPLPEPEPEDEETPHADA